MTQGSGMFYNLGEVTAVTAQGSVYNNKKGQSDQQKKKDKDGYKAIYDLDMVKAHPDDDIDICTTGYTKTGAPASMSLHMHDYTFQTKTC